MSADLDRFDRMLLGIAPASPTRATFRAGPVRAYVPPDQREREPVITSKRPPRFVDHTSCPMCGIDRIGIEFHGELLDGSKVHQLAAHAPEMRRCENGKPRCLGAGMRVAFVNGEWRGFVRVVEGAQP